MRPGHLVVPNQIVTTAIGARPDGPARRALQRHRLPIEVNVPSTGMEGQHRQITAAARTAQVDGAVLVADPQLAVLDFVERGHCLNEDGSKTHGGQLTQLISHKRCALYRAGTSGRTKWSPKHTAQFGGATP